MSPNRSNGCDCCRCGCIIPKPMGSMVGGGGVATGLIAAAADLAAAAAALLAIIFAISVGFGGLGDVFAAALVCGRFILATSIKYH